VVVNDSVELEVVSPDASLLLVMIEDGLLATLNPVFLGVNFKLLDADAKRGFLRAGVPVDGRLPCLTGVAEINFLFTGLNGSFLVSTVFLVTDPGCFKLSFDFGTEFNLELFKRGFLAVGLILGGGSIFSLQDCFSIIALVCFFTLTSISSKETPSDSSILLNLFSTTSSSFDGDTISRSPLLVSVATVSHFVSPTKLGDTH